VTVASTFVGFVTPAAATATVSSTFETDADGWVTLNDGTLSYAATGGNPGGYIGAVDRGEGSWWYFQAPAKYLGDKSAYVGGSLSFDARQSPLANDAPTYGDVVLVGTNGMALAYNFASPPGTGWTAFEAPLVAAGWTVANVGTAGGQVTYTQSSVAPTDAEFEAVVADLAALYVRGEYRSGADSSALDNVVLAAAPDDIPPTIDAVTVAPSLVAGGGPVTVTASAVDDTGVVTVTADGVGLTQDATGNWTGTLTAPTTDGTVSVSVVAADAAGNTATATGSYTVDATPPAIDAVTVVPSLVAGGGLVTVTVSASDDNGVAGVAADGVGLVQNPTGEWVGTLVGPSGDGTVTAFVTATDVVGNTATDSSASYLVDATPPTFDAVTLTPTLVAAGAPVAVTASVSDANGVAGVTADGVGLTQDAADNWTGTLTAPTTDGTATVALTATDVVGNTATASASYTVDATPPTIDSVTFTPALGGPADPVTITVSASDANGVAGVTADGLGLTQDAAGNWTGTLTASSVDGPVLVAVTATDVVGNTATDSSASYLVDATPPTITAVTLAPDPVVPGGSGVVEATVFDANGVSGVTADGVTFTDADGDGTWTGTLTAPPTGGPVTVLVTATDVVGNTATSASTSYLVVFPVAVDVDPQDVDNNVSTKGIIRVVLFGTDDVPVSDIDYGSLRFGNVTGVEAGGGAAPAPAQATPTRDVDGDGRDDVTVQFKADESGLAPGDTLAVVVGSLTDGTPFRGVDGITVEVPGNGKQ
jgi:hypothetical protein